MWSSRFFAAIIAIVLSGCGGGGGSTPGSLTGYPDCALGIDGEDGLAGCWVSELCATSAITEETYGVDSVRQLIRFTEDSVSPTVTGSTRFYFLGYNTPDCSGPSRIVLDMNAAAARDGLILRQSYEVLGYALCGNANDLTADDIACVRMNASLFHQVDGGAPMTMSGDVYYRIDAPRLCLDLPFFDDDGGGSFIAGDGPVSDPRLYLEPGDCLTRFLP